jgi:hypothetical protein
MPNETFWQWFRRIFDAHFIPIFLFGVLFLCLLGVGVGRADRLTWWEGMSDKVLIALLGVVTGATAAKAGDK